MENKDERELAEVRDETLLEGMSQLSALQAEPVEIAAEETAHQEAAPVEVAINNVNDPMSEAPSAAERMASNAREQATAAADALRRGEFMRDAAVDAEADNDDRLIALLCYVTQMVIPLVMPVLVLMSESSKKRPFQRFHAVQSLALVSLFVVASLLVTIGTAIVSIIPVIGWLIGLTVLCLSPIAVLMGYFAVGYYGFQAYLGKRFGIPGLTSFLKDQGWI